MIPVTHFVYLAVALFLIGFGGLLFRRSLLTVLMCAQLILASAGLILVAYSRWWGNHDGQAFAVVVAVIGAAQLVMGLAVGYRLAGPRELGGPDSTEGES
jgi:NADH-quinone oxidoreductase subunit K